MFPKQKKSDIQSTKLQHISKPRRKTNKPVSMLTSENLNALNQRKSTCFPTSSMNNSKTNSERKHSHTSLVKGEAKKVELTSQVHW